MGSISDDVSVIKSCMEDPTSTACSDKYGAVTNLPGVIAAKCEDSTCSTISQDVSSIKSCMEDPTSTACFDTYGAATNLPGVVTAKCDDSTCSSLRSDLTPLMDCMTDPASADCSATYSSPSSLPVVVAGKCEGSVCSLLETCLTTPADGACTITQSSSLPALVTNLDRCMTSIEDSTCTASYGSPASLVSAGGSGVVGWIQQFKKPAFVQCAYTSSSALSFEDLGSGSTGLTVAAGNIPANCDVGRQYQILPFDQCSHSEPDASTSTHLMPEGLTQSEYVEIKSEGWYKVEFTAMLQTVSDRRFIRADVYKVSSKDPANSCSTQAETCDVALQIRFISRITDIPPDPSDNTDISAHNEGAFHLCSGDKIIVIISKSSSATNNLGDILGGTDSRTILVLTKIWFP